MPHQLSMLPNESVISPPKVKEYQPSCWNDCKRCEPVLHRRYTNNPHRKIFRNCELGQVCYEETRCCAQRVPLEGQERLIPRQAGWDDF